MAWKMCSIVGDYGCGSKLAYAWSERWWEKTCSDCIGLIESKCVILWNAFYVWFPFSFLSLSLITISLALSPPPISPLSLSSYSQPWDLLLLDEVTVDLDVMGKKKKEVARVDVWIENPRETTPVDPDQTMITHHKRDLPLRRDYTTNLTISKLSCLL